MLEMGTVVCAPNVFSAVTKEQLGEYRKQHCATHAGKSAKYGEWFLSEFRLPSGKTLHIQTEYNSKSSFIQIL